MGRRYMCEYCDKSFQDNPVNRRNHLNGVQHRTLRQQHYDSLHDPEVILSEDNTKKPCRKFQQDGECKFGSGCRYSHMTAEERDRLKAAVRVAQDLRKSKLAKQNSIKEPTLEDWLEKRSKRHASMSKIDDSKVVSNSSIQSIFTLPDSLKGIPNLPPSLIPPPPEALLTNSILHNDWV